MVDVRLTSRNVTEQHASSKLSALICDFYTHNNRCWPHRQAERVVHTVSQGWPVLAFWSLHKKTPSLVPSLPIGRHLQRPPSRVVHLGLRCHLQPSGRRWTFCWVLLPVASPAFSLIPWRWSRPACSCRENCVHGAPTRDTTEGPCRRSGWWAAMMGCVACRRASQSGLSTRGWWTVSGWAPTPIVKLWVSPPTMGGVCCQELGLEPWVPSLPLLPT